VLVEGQPHPQALAAWREGVLLDDKLTAPAEVEIISSQRDHSWLRVTLSEGRKRQIRRVAAMLGFPAQRLIRDRLGPLELGDLPAGGWRRLSPAEVGALRQSVADDPPTPRRARRRRQRKERH
jgi:pseudouridine synthase